MRVVFTCGGTGGHINPALAVAKMLRERQPDCEILFIGAEEGMEKTLVPREGFRLETIRISSFQRRLTPKGIWHNLITAVDIYGALRKVSAILKEFKPNVILGTGGYASFPALRQGAKLKIPTAVHESNAVPGLATRMVMNHVDRILVCFEESREQYRNPEKVYAVGMPVSEAFIYTKREDARRELGIPEDHELIVSCWGSLGAREMNKKIARFIQLESETDAYHHIHATGSYGWRWMPDFVKGLGVDLKKHPNIDMREYIYNMPTLMAAADLVICRAGASTLNEVAASAVPAIIVPSPNVTDNHQEKNARLLERRNAAMVIRESECDGDVLYARAGELLRDPERLQTMRRALRSMAVLDSTERIYRMLQELAAP